MNKITKIACIILLVGFILIILKCYLISIYVNGLAGGLFLSNIINNYKN